MIALVIISIPFAIVVAVVAASGSRLISTATAARILIGIPLLGIGILDAVLNIHLWRDHGAGTLLVQVPTAILLIAFMGATFPSGWTVGLQFLGLMLMAMIGLITIFSVGSAYLAADVFLLLGMLYTGAAASANSAHNQQYWLDYYSHHG